MFIEGYTKFLARNTDQPQEHLPNRLNKLRYINVSLGKNVLHWKTLNRYSHSL